MSTAATLFSINGVLTDQHTVADRAFAFGDGVFETLRLSAGAAPLWTLHRERLLTGCQRLYIPMTAAAADAALTQILRVCRQRHIAEATLKFTVSRGVAPRGYGIPPDTTPTLVWAVYPEAGAEPGPAHLCICTHRLADHPPLAGIKHLNRLDNVLLRLECERRGYRDGVVLNYAGQVIEAVASNIFVRIAGSWHTPPVDRCGIAGVTRRVLLEQVAAGAGPAITVSALDIAGLPHWEEAFLTSSISGIQPVEQIDAHRLMPGSDTRRFADAFRQIVSPRGRSQ